ncbi:MAG TPA: HAD family phosphatase [Phnomibacter sp.]|nr:HAD family phosphatase [Phnomibacter sp.]
MSSKKAFLFDLNGTMVDDMRYHVVAWHDILNSLGAGLSMEQVNKECYGKNDELLERIFPGRFSVAEKTSMSYAKEEAYQKAFRPHLKLIEGLGEYLEAAKQQGIRMAIGSAAIMFNIDFVIDNLHIRHYFDAIVSADDVVISKPHPETYLKCAEALNAKPADCLVFEDSPKGVESAKNAGMQSIVLLGMHTTMDFLDYNNVIYFGNNYIDMPMG